MAQQALTDRGIFGRSIPEAERMFLTGRIDPERDDQAALGEDHAVDEERHQIQAIQRRRLPRADLRCGARHEAPTDTALARPPAAHLGRQRLEAARVAPRRDAQQHLFDDPPIERIGLGHRLERRQRHLVMPGPHPGPANLDFASAQHDATRRRPGAAGLPLGLVGIPRPADRDPILFEHRFEHLHPRSDDELGQFGARVDQHIDQRQVAGFRFLRLGDGVDCARLLLHGGSFRCGLRRG
jgi:hypothetical protein